jgi:hypothetical protein
MIRTVRVARGRESQDNHFNFNLKTTPAIATITAINNPQPSTVRKSKVLIPVSVYLVKQKVLIPVSVYLVKQKVLIPVYHSSIPVYLWY